MAKRGRKPKGNKGKVGRLQIHDGTSEIWHDGALVGWVHAFDNETDGIRRHFWAVVGGELDEVPAYCFQHDDRHELRDTYTVFRTAAQAAMGSGVVTSRYKVY